MVPLSCEKVEKFGERALWLGESSVDRPFKASCRSPFSMLGCHGNLAHALSSQSPATKQRNSTRTVFNVRGAMICMSYLVFPGCNWTAVGLLDFQVGK